MSPTIVAIASASKKSHNGLSQNQYPANNIVEPIWLRVDVIALDNEVNEMKIIIWVEARS